MVGSIEEEQADSSPPWTILFSFYRSIDPFVDKKDNQMFEPIILRSMDKGSKEQKVGND